MNTADRTLVTSYATALFQAALKKGVLEQIAPQAQSVSSIVEAEANLRTFLNAPNIASEDKEALFSKLFAGRADELLVNFLRLLVRRGRLLLLVPVLEEFHRVYLAHKGFAQGRVTTAVALSEKERQEIASALSRFTGKTLQIEYKVDPKVIGGVKFESGDLLVENTLTSGLHRLEQSLRRARVY